MVPKAIKNLFLYSAGHTYSNLSRLFLRLFTGVMFMQLSVRQILHFDDIVPEFAGFWGMSADCSIAILVVVELLCATFIILGFLLRIAVLPPMVMMCFAEEAILSSGSTATNLLYNFQPGYPIMFLGIFAYMLLAGPGKISLEYLFALHLTQGRNDSENELLDKA